MQQGWARGAELSFWSRGMGGASHSTAQVLSQVILGFLGLFWWWTQSLDSSAPHCVDVAKPLSLYAGKLLMAALCWHKYCPLNTCGPLLPLLLLLDSGKGFLIYCLCPTELNRSKLMITGMTGDNALWPVGSRSHFVALCNCCPLFCFCFFFFLFHYAHNSPNEWGVFGVAMAPELRNQRWHGVLGHCVPLVVMPRPCSWFRCAVCTQPSLSCLLPPSPPAAEPPG